MRVVGKIWIMLACLLLLVACSSDDPISSPVIVSTPAATPPSEEMNVGPIIWAQATDAATGKPTDIVTIFTTESPAIIAVIEVSDVPEGTEFTATWTINNQPIASIDMNISASDDLDHAWIAFSFTRDDGQLYPVGQLGVVITSSEGDLREGSAEIGFP